MRRAGNLANITEQISKVCPNASKPTHRLMISRSEVMGFARVLPGGTSCTGHRAPKRDAFSFERLYVIQSQPSTLIGSHIFLLRVPNYLTRVVNKILGVSDPALKATTI